jgi:DNA-binding NarL/FixJ family response regulator
MQPDHRAAGQTATVWIVEDNDEFRTTVQDLVDLTEGFTAPHAFSSGEELFEHLNQHLAPDALLVDIGLPEMDGLEVARRMNRLAPDTRVVILTIHEDNDLIFQAICNGASGYLLKTADSTAIVQALREALQGGAPMTPQIARRVLNFFTQMRAPAWDYQLTDRERDVLRELIEGKTKRQMGKSLFLSEHTIDSHLRNIYTKLHVHSRTEAVVKAIKENLVPLEEGADP